MKAHNRTDPLLLQVPLTQYRAAPQSPAAAMLYTGNDQTISAALADNLFVQNTLTAAGIAAPVANFQAQAAQVTHASPRTWQNMFAAWRATAERTLLCVVFMLTAACSFCMELGRDHLHIATLAVYCKSRFAYSLV